MGAQLAMQLLGIFYITGHAMSVWVWYNFLYQSTKNRLALRNSLLRTLSWVILRLASIHDMDIRLPLFTREGRLSM